MYETKIDNREVFSFNGEDYPSQAEAVKARSQYFIDSISRGEWDFFISVEITYPDKEQIVDRIIAVPRDKSVEEQYTLFFYNIVMPGYSTRFTDFNGSVTPYMRPIPYKTTSIQELTEKCQTLNYNLESIKFVFGYGDDNYSNIEVNIKDEEPIYDEPVVREKHSCEYPQLPFGGYIKDGIHCYISD